MIQETGRPLKERILTLLKGVPDPEIPVLSVLELGIVRDIRVDGRPAVAITPTYTGCPATRVIEDSIRNALDAAGLSNVAIVTELSPPWTTDWISDSGRAKLLAYGIVPPPAGSGRGSLRESVEIRCPRCSSANTAEISRFGSTPCKALHRCLDCAEPFDLFKCH